MDKHTPHIVLSGKIWFQVCGFECWVNLGLLGPVFSLTPNWCWCAGHRLMSARVYSLEICYSFLFNLMSTREVLHVIVLFPGKTDLCVFAIEISATSRRYSVKHHNPWWHSLTCLILVQAVRHRADCCKFMPSCHLALPAQVHVSKLSNGSCKLHLTVTLSVEADAQEETKAVQSSIQARYASGILASWLQKRAQRQLTAQLKPESSQLWELPQTFRDQPNLPPSLRPITADSFSGSDFEEWGWIVNIVFFLLVFLLNCGCFTVLLFIEHLCW